jgi:hypothetical protein
MSLLTMFLLAIHFISFLVPTAFTTNPTATARSTSAAKKSKGVRSRSP